MMATRSLLTLTFATLIVVVACLIAVGARYNEPTYARKEGGLVFSSLKEKLGSVVNIEINRAGDKFTLARHEGTWINRGIGGFGARSARIETAIAALAGLKFVAAKTSRSKLHRRLGVEDVGPTSKSTRMTLKDIAGGILADIIVGKPKERVIGSDRQGAYIRMPGHDRAWLAQGLLDIRFDAPDWSDRTVVDIDTQSLATLTLRHADGETITLHRHKLNDPKLTLRELLADTEIKYQYQIDYLAGLLKSLRFDDAKRSSSAESNVSPIVEVMARLKSDLTVTVRVVRPASDGAIWAGISARRSSDMPVSDSAKREAARINRKFDGWIVRLPRRIADRLKIRLRDIVGPSQTLSNPKNVSPTNQGLKN